MRARKDYRLPPQPAALFEVGIPGALVVRFLDAAGAPAQVLDLSAHADRAHMAGEFVFALRHHLADKSNPHRQGMQYGLAWWFRFLDELDPERNVITTLGNICSATLRSYIAWLDQKPIVKSSRARIWASVKLPLLWLKRHRPDLLQTDLDMPIKPFARKSLGARPRAALPRAELDAVLAACKADIEASWADFQRGRTLVQNVDIEAVNSADLSDIDLKDLGVLLALIDRRYGGVIPRRPQPDANGKTCWRLHQAIRRHGGNQRISRFLHATAETLIPYMIAIGAQTFANPEALRNMRRDCMTEHIFLEGRVHVDWTKGRSRRVQRRSFLRGRSLSVPNLIDRVLSMTAPLVQYVSSRDEDQLFLVGGILTRRRIGLVPHDAVVEHVKSFALRHDLRNLAGTPLALTLAVLRPTGLTLAHSALGNDVLKTQVLANHADPDQTRHYVNQPIIRAEQATGLAQLQGRFFEAVRRGDELTSLGGQTPSTLSVDTRNATASGFICSDPLAGIAPGQHSGQLCTAWLGCFTCPNAVIPLDPETLARLLCMRDALADARGAMALDRWLLLYAPKLEIIERDILPRFPSDVHALAQARVAYVAPPPPIE